MIEELLRLVSVFDILMRVATADIILEGHTIRTGDGIVVSLSLTNRDPAHHPTPHTLDPRQASPRHHAFGGGPHQCLGHHLARTELHIAFRALLTSPASRICNSMARVCKASGVTGLDVARVGLR
ncbi:cytochrome P450 [Streptomyces sp. NPDC052101]|uniref:cytochrome P450 n=1 Tax=Streptomyces sp. NPDC052101 TaxID=3155763 RepID=UPI003447EA94